MMIYETMFVNRAETPPEKIKETAESIQKLINQDNGEVLLSENWGKRKLTFDIKGCRDGNFSRIVFSAKPEFIKELNKSLQIDENIIRHIILKAPKALEKQGKPDEKADSIEQKQEDEKADSIEQKQEDEKADSTEQKQEDEKADSTEQKQEDEKADSIEQKQEIEKEENK